VTDEVMKELVTKHDMTISHLVSSVEHLVQSQTVTNERLEEISKFLAKQVVFGSKLDNMDRDLTDSFKRVYGKIDEVDIIQKSAKGCNSVRLLTKDVETLTRDVTRLIGNSEEHRLHIETLDRKIASYPPRGAMLTVTVIVVGYMITFGAYVTQTLNALDKTNVKLTTLIERDIKDVSNLMRVKTKQGARNDI